MKKVTRTQLYAVSGGASKYVTCAVCGYKSRSTLYQRLFWSNEVRQTILSGRHCSLLDGYDPSQKVHVF